MREALLSKLSLPITELPSALYQSLRAMPSVRTASPEHLSAVLKASPRALERHVRERIRASSRGWNSSSMHRFSCADAEVLVQFLLRDRKWEYLYKLRLLPLSSGDLGTFDRSSSQTSYYGRPDTVPLCPRACFFRRGECMRLDVLPQVAPSSSFRCCTNYPWSIHPPRC